MEAGRAGGAGRGRFPFEELALREDEPHQGQPDRVHGAERVVGQEGQLEAHLRGRDRDLLDHVSQERGQRLAPGRPAEQAGHLGIDGERRAQHQRRGPDPRRARQPGPRRRQEEQHRGGNQAAPQVVENLPAADDRQAVALHALARRHPGEHPEEDLPVPSHPAALAIGVRQDAGGEVVHELEVGDQRGARVQALEQVVRQHRVLGHAPRERGAEGVHVVQAFAGVDPLVEQVLVHIRDRGGIRVDPRVAGVDPREARACGASHGHAHARL